MNITESILNRARGCLAGQLAGDALGSLVEFKTAETIAELYPDGGPFELADGGVWQTIAGQATDDSEMALGLARSIVEQNGYDPKAAFAAYQFWLDSDPFDCGNTIRDGITGRLNHESQANGALMRASPLGVFAAGRPEADAAAWARADAALTHPNGICQAANELFVLAVARAVADGPSPQDLYAEIAARATASAADESFRRAVAAAAEGPPGEFRRQQGWVLIALQNALWQLARGARPFEAVVDTVRRGGDTDTNAAICGALLGAVYGETALPAQWLNALAECRPKAGKPGVKRPRPEIYWPADARPLAEALLKAGRAA